MSQSGGTSGTLAVPGGPGPAKQILVVRDKPSASGFLKACRSQRSGPPNNLEALARIYKKPCAHTMQ